MAGLRERRGLSPPCPGWEWIEARRGWLGRGRRWERLRSAAPSSALLPGGVVGDRGGVLYAPDPKA